MSELPLVEVAYRTIREKLLNAEFLPGSLFSENELAQQRIGQNLAIALE
ncbi:hypothetical protein ABDI30_02710 [Paenibacillus cisolokensis]